MLSLDTGCSRIWGDSTPKTLPVELTTSRNKEKLEKMWSMKCPLCEYTLTCAHAYQPMCTPVHVDTSPHAHLSTWVPVYVHTCAHTLLFTCIPLHMCSCPGVYLDTCIPHVCTCAHAYLSRFISVHVCSCACDYQCTCHLSRCVPVQYLPMLAYLYTCILVHVRTYQQKRKEK